MRKALNKVGIEGNYLNTIITISEKPTSNIILSGESLKYFPLKSETMLGCLLLPFLFNIV